MGVSLATGFYLTIKWPLTKTSLSLLFLSTPLNPIPSFLSSLTFTLPRRAPLFPLSMKIDTFLLFSHSKKLTDNYDLLTTYKKSISQWPWLPVSLLEIPFAWEHHRNFTGSLFGNIFYLTMPFTCRELWSWPGLGVLRGMSHRVFKLESVAPEALCDFQFLRNLGIHSS